MKRQRSFPDPPSFPQFSLPPQDLPDFQDSVSDRIKRRGRRKNLTPKIIVLILLVSIGAFICIWGPALWSTISKDGPFLLRQITTQSFEEQMVWKWINENEGEPSSVEIIHIEGLRYSGGIKTIRVKYRAINPFGGPSVYERILKIEGQRIYK